MCIRDRFDLGKGTENNSPLVRNPDSFGRPGAGSESAADPQRALIEMGEEFRSDRPALKKHNDRDDACDTDPHRDVPVMDGLCLLYTSRCV